MTGATSEQEQQHAPLEADTATMLRCLRWLRPGDTKWLLTKINPVAKKGSRNASTTYLADDEAAARELREANKLAGLNIYLPTGSPNEKWDLSKGNQPRKEADEIGSCSLQYFDGDFLDKDGNVIATEESRLTDINAAVANGVIPGPGLIINSGNGLQCFWRYREPLDPEQAEGRNRWLIEILHGDPGVWDRGRLMRVGGGINWPSKKKIAKGCVPVLGRIITINDEAWATADQFQWVPEKKEQPKSEPPTDASKSSEDTAPAEPVTSLDDPRIAFIRADVKQVIVDGCGDKYPSRSEAAWRVMCYLVRCEVPKAVVRSIFMNFKIGDSFRDSSRKFEGAFERTYERAAEKAKIDPSKPLILSASNWTENAQQFLMRVMPDLIWHRGDFLSYDGRAYVAVDDATMTARARHFLDQALKWVFNKKTKELELKPFAPGTNQVRELFNALRDNRLIEGDLPRWADGVEGPPAEECISLQNGILHVPTRKLLDPTPDFITRNGLGFAYDPQADCVLWNKTLSEWWPPCDDSTSASEVSLLAQIFGYLLVPWTSLQKYFLFHGPGRSGKGTITRVLAMLLGKENYAAPSVGQLGKEFGLASLIGKLVALISETEFGRNDDPVAVTATLKKITGEDDVEVPRKFKPNWIGRLVTRFVLSTNKLPAFADDSEALGTRTIILKMTKSFAGSENPNLTAELAKELPGILNWALDGYDHLRESGQFTITAAGKEMVARLNRLASPVRTFVEDRCLKEDGKPLVTEAELHAAYTRWCQANGLHAMRTTQFVQSLTEAFPKITQFRDTRHCPKCLQPGACATAGKCAQGGKLARPHCLKGIRLLRPGEATEDEDLFHAVAA